LIAIMLDPSTMRRRRSNSFGHPKRIAGIYMVEKLKPLTCSMNARSFG
jgi:hypothetical protein